MTPDQLLRLADQCVKCGLCLPACPTFAKLGNEADSPRGRIALIQGWAGGALDLTPTLASHLDGCLGCRACEGACPSLVEYGRLADGARAARIGARSGLSRGWLRLWLGLLADARLHPWLAAAVRIYTGQWCVARGAWRDIRTTPVPRGYPRGGLARLAERTGLAGLRALRPWHRLARAIPAASAPVPPADPGAADLEIFVGCMGGLAQGRAIAAARVLLHRLDRRVRIPAAPACCGALHRHNGLPRDADRRRDACARGLAEPPLAGLASACVAELREAPGSADTWELCDWLNRLPALGTLAFRPLGQRVLVHEPCSHRHLLGGNGAVYALLQRIPGLAVTPLAGNQSCCGAAGTYLLQQPAMAESLLADKLAAIAAAAPDLIVTTNPGCALHLIAGVREAGLAVEVCHPVELLARQLL